MPDVILIVTAKAKPGKEKELERALREVGQPTRQQPGCVRFSLYRSEQDPGDIVGIEHWKSKTKLGAAMGNIIPGPPQILWHEIIDEV
ncbi:MAG TPA: putative quinol monooxygenase [Bryobacteraceae bacterium]|nr:putative quinol monooxygenase [Bryobacteraceae bacterium]